MPWTKSLDMLADPSLLGTRYEAIAGALDSAIVNGELTLGEQLPTVRQLSAHLGVSPTTVGAAYKLLRERGLISSAVGHGTFVIKTRRTIEGSLTAPAAPVQFAANVGQTVDAERRHIGSPWRKRALASSTTFLSSYGPTLDCGSGRPDPDLLPLHILTASWHHAIADLQPNDLQYVGAEPLPALVPAILPRLASDGIDAEPGSLLVGSSAQQFMMLALDVIAALGDGKPLVVAVEEPGYPTIFDAFERAGARLIAVGVDRFGARPDLLAKALETGAQVLLVTPRAHNPTGASWNRGRRLELADVLADYRDVFVIEDDQFAGLAQNRPGSLYNDERLQERVIYVRSFSKSIAPDLRIAVAIARPRLRSMLVEAKTFADGWTSRLIQRVLIEVLEHPDLDPLLNHAAAAYAARRDAVSGVLSKELAPHGGCVWPHRDGVNVWIQLPSGLEGFEVVERAAALGVRTAPGEPFFIRPGHGDVLRINAGSIHESLARDAAGALVKAATMVAGNQMEPTI